MVGGVPELPGQDAQPAAQRVGDGAHPGGGAVQRGEPVRCRRLDHLPPGGARPDGGGAAHRVDPYGVHPGGTDQDPALDGARQAVPGGVDGDPEPARGGACHGVTYVIGPGGLDDEVRADRETGLESGRESGPGTGRGGSHGGGSPVARSMG